MNKTKTFLFGILLLLIGVTRLPYLGRDTINPDGVNWHYRSEQFIVGLKYQDWAKTYQHYHPGVTLMWIMGVPIEMYKQVTNFTYNHETFMDFHVISKASVVVVQLALTLLGFYLLSKVISPWKAFFVTLVFSLEPFFAGNSRLLHLDVLMTLFIFNGLILNFWAIKEFKWWKTALAGAFFALAFLTKSVSIGVLLFGLGVGGTWFYIQNKNLRKLGVYLSSMLVSFLAVTFILFPALWVKPVETLTEIFSEGERVGVRKGHGQIVLGEYTRDASIWFYPLVLLMKTSPFTLVGIVIYFWFLVTNVKKLKNSGEFRPLDSFILFTSIFYLVYILVMSFPTKKIDRYIVPMFPFLALLAVSGYSYLEKFKKFTWPIIGALFSALIIYPLISFYPYYFTYTSPLFGSTQNANRVIAQKPFGVGIYDLKNFIFEKYGEYPTLGFIDVKPMEAIYMSSKICDIRVCGTDDYDLLVLGPNESIPEDVLDSKASFRHDSSFWVNGLEYWKIYVKEASNRE